MNKPNEEKVKQMLANFTPDQQGMARHIAETQIQNKLMTKQLADLKAAYDELYKVMIVLLHADPDHELRMHSSHFLRFKDEYRIDRVYDEGTEEVVMKLMALGDIDENNN